MNLRRAPVLTLALVGLAALVRPGAGPEPIPSAKPAERIRAEAVEAVGSESGVSVVLDRGVRDAFGSNETDDVVAFREITHREWVLRYVAQRLEEAYSAFDRERHADVSRICFEILRLDPDYPVVREVLSCARKAGHGSFSPGAWDPVFDPWKAATGWTVEGLIPEPERFRVPTPEEWEQYLKAELSGDPAARSAVIRRVLETRRVDFDFVDTKVEDVLLFIVDDPELGVRIDPELRGRADLDQPISLSAFGVSAQRAFDLVFAVHGKGLRMRVTSEGTLLITDRRNPGPY